MGFTGDGIVFYRGLRWARPDEMSDLRMHKKCLDFFI